MTCDKGRKGFILTANVTEAELISPIRTQYVIKPYLSKVPSQCLESCQFQLQYF